MFYALVTAASYQTLSILSFVFKSLILKFLLFFGLFFVASEFIGFITGCGCIPAVDSITTAFNRLPAALLWFIGWMNFAFGLRVILCAMAVRFLIRRIPFFG